MPSLTVALMRVHTQQLAPVKNSTVSTCTIYLGIVVIALGVGCGEKQLTPSVAIIIADPDVQFGAVSPPYSPAA
jgi:hypothetical protein